MKHDVQNAPASKTGNAAKSVKQIFSIRVGSCWYGVDIEKVRTVFNASAITRVPLAPPAIAGLVNVRGEVLTAIDLHAFLAVPKHGSRKGYLLVGITHKEEDFGLIIDAAGDIIDVNDDDRITVPVQPDQRAIQLSLATYRAGDRLIPVLDIQNMLSAIGSTIQPIAA